MHGTHASTTPWLRVSVVNNTVQKLLGVLLE